MSNVPSAEELDASFQAFKNVVTHPEFQKALEEIQNLPEDQRLDAASTQLTAQVLAVRGVPILQGMSIITYNVESPGDPTTRAVEAGTTQPNAMAGASAVFSNMF